MSCYMDLIKIIIITIIIIIIISHSNTLTKSVSRRVCHKVQAAGKIRN